MRTDQIEEVEVTIEKKSKKVKSRAGRPKSEVPKAKKVLLSFTEEQHSSLLKQAEAEGRTLTNFLTLAALEYIK